jgi:hypothetical protein
MTAGAHGSTIFAVSIVLLLPLAVFTISRFGWAALAARYRRTSEEKPIKIVHFQQMSLGSFGPRYNNCIDIGESARGLFLSVMFPLSLGHEPLFIPWSDVTPEGERRVWFATFDVYRIGSIASLYVHANGAGARMIRERLAA